MCSHFSLYSYGFISRSSDRPTLDSRFSDSTPDPSLPANLGNQVDKTHDSVPSPTDILTDKTMPDSRALVSVPAMSLEALTVVPMNMKTNRSDIIQRRTRRPFSVSEVEALVHAVEELGTGRFDCRHHIFHCCTSVAYPPNSHTIFLSSIKRISFFVGWHLEFQLFSVPQVA